MSELGTIEHNGPFGLNLKTHGAWVLFMARPSNPTRTGLDFIDQNRVRLNPGSGWTKNPKCAPLLHASDIRI